MFFKSNIPFLSQTSINGKSLNWTPNGYATHLLSQDETFSRKKNAITPISFEIHLPNQKFNKWKESQLDPYWICYASPFGGKTF